MVATIEICPKCRGRGFTEENAGLVMRKCSCGGRIPTRISDALNLHNEPAGEPAKRGRGRPRKEQ